jgi:hypothetical protein
VCKDTKRRRKERKKFRQGEKSGLIFGLVRGGPIQINEVRRGTGLACSGLISVCWTGKKSIPDLPSIRGRGAISHPTLLASLGGPSMRYLFGRVLVQAAYFPPHLLR